MNARSEAGARITVVTSGHLSTCPRMLKATDTLNAAGYRVRVVATCHEPWAADADRDVRARRALPVSVVDYRRGHGSTYWRSGLRHQLARRSAAAVGPARAPWAIVTHAFGRVHAELVEAAIEAPADFIYGGTTGALAASSCAARRLGVPYGIDFEDFHSGETSGVDAPFVDALAARIERQVASGAAFVTTSSAAIASAYQDAYAISPVVIHNTFALPKRPPEFRRSDPLRLRLYWFSQTVGPGRGLELAVDAIGQAEIAADLTVRGRPLPGYLESLSSLAAARAPRLRIAHEAPAPPDAMVDLASGHDIGLALEEMAPRNRQLCLPNKPLTYLLAGLAVALTDTPGQHPLGTDLGTAAALVAPGDVDALASALAAWSRDAAVLERAKRCAWAAAVRRWHWEHPLESGRLCALVRDALQPRS